MVPPVFVGQPGRGVNVPLRAALRLLRMRMKWSRFRAAVELGAGPDSILAWERGLRTPKPLYQRRIRDAFRRTEGAKA